MKHTTGEVTTKEFKLLPRGEYPFVVNYAEETVSKKTNNPMIKLNLQVGTKPDHRYIYDYLVFDGKSEWKFDVFLKAVGMYPGVGVEMEIKPDDLIGREGRVSIKVEKYNGEDTNRIGAYIINENAPTKSVREPEEDDNIPF